jgi:hypothetical protein
MQYDHQTLKCTKLLHAMKYTAKGGHLQEMPILQALRKYEGKDKETG